MMFDVGWRERFTFTNLKPHVQTVRGTEAAETAARSPRLANDAAQGGGGQDMPRHKGELRIVGGMWRSRRIRFPGGVNVRPTPDRVRETLFNWLGNWIEGKCVLDLFAGSGALGFEALSRGAAEAIFVERSRPAAEAIRSNAVLLEAAGASVACADALRFLDRTEPGYDLVFIDPPYARGLAGPALEALVGRRLLNAGGFVYVEHSASVDKAATRPVIPQGLALYRELHAGMVHGVLLRK